MTDSNDASPSGTAQQENKNALLAPVQPSSPEMPSTSFLDETQRQLRQRIDQVHADHRLPRLDDYEAQRGAWKRITDHVDVIADDLKELLLDLHRNPELAFEERRSQQVLVEFAERKGFSAARGVYGVETSFEVSWQSEDFDSQRHPTVAIMAEYDALPGIGHACGHNIIAAAGMGAFVSAVRAAENISGRLELIGTPAEEGHSGKEYMLREGMLDGVDIAMMVHPFSYDIDSHIWVGRRTMVATFDGVAAHASSQPFMGRNALDAANLAYQGIGLLRQQMPPSDRVHAVVSNGGHRPSVIPERAALDVYVRSLYTETLQDFSDRIDDVMRGAALIAGVSVDIEWDIHPMTLPVINNQALARRWSDSQALRDRVVLPADVVPSTLAASTDFGNVSQIVPSIHPMVKIAPEGVALHTEEFARWAASDDAVTAALDSASGLAQVATDVLADPKLLDSAQREFQQMQA